MDLDKLNEDFLDSLLENVAAYKKLFLAGI